MVAYDQASPIGGLRGRAGPVVGPSCLRQAECRYLPEKRLCLAEFAKE